MTGSEGEQERDGGEIEKRSEDDEDHRGNGEEEEQGTVTPEPMRRQLEELREGLNLHFEDIYRLIRWGRPGQDGGDDPSPVSAPQESEEKTDDNGEDRNRPEEAPCFIPLPPSDVRLTALGVFGGESLTLVQSISGRASFLVSGQQKRIHRCVPLGRVEEGVMWGLHVAAARASENSSKLESLPAKSLADLIGRELENLPRSLTKPVDNVVRSAVNRLRKKIREKLGISEPVIVTRDKGYRLGEK